MVTSVFLSNNTVFIAGGAEGKNLPKHAESIIYRMPEGSLLNGMITNEQELTEQLRELWRKRALPKDHVRLVLESSHFSVKTLAVPKMKEKEVRGVVLREFAEMEQYEEKLYDHAVLQSVEGGGQDILAVMVNRSYIEGWQKIFHDIGVELERITVSRETMTRYFASCEQLRQGAYVLILLDDMILTSVLWIDGRLVSADRKRVFSEVGSEEFYTEISRSVSSIRQYYISQKRRGKLSKLFLCGFQEQDVGCCQESLDRFELEMQVESLREPYADNVMAAGGLITAKKPVNMLQVWKEKKREDKGIGTFVKRAVPVLVLFAVCLLISIGLMIGSSIRMKKATELSEYLTDTTLMQEKMLVEELKRDISSMERMMEQADQIRAIKKSYPLADGAVTDKIRSAADYNMTVRIVSYNADAGELNVEIRTPVVESVNRYVSALQETGMFVKVGYSGYGYLEGEGNYQVQVSCILSGDAGK